jgi:dUTP pyrophosphatase
MYNSCIIKYGYILHIQADNEVIKTYYMDHSHAYGHDSGIDVFFSENVIVPPNTLGFVINLGIKAEMINLDDNSETAYLIIPRSSIYRTPLRPAISVSLIDAGFRGNLSIFVDNLSKYPYPIIKGTRLFQIIGPSLKQIKINIKDKLSIGIRGDRGLGSSGQVKTNKNEKDLCLYDSQRGNVFPAKL